MDKMTDIAKDYLADFEVLTEARKEFENQLGGWWPELTNKRVRLALTNILKDVTGGEPNGWENQSNPGVSHFRVVANQEVLVQIADPRISGRGCYTVSLFADKQPTLKKLNNRATFVDSLNKLTSELSGAGNLVAKTSAAELIAVDIPINPDDFEETAKRVSDTAVRMFKLVIENYRLKNADEKA